MAASMAIAAIAGEEAWAFASNLIKLGDGSWIAVQLDKPAYFAGEVLSGRVNAQIHSPVVCDCVALKIRVKEKVQFDEEASFWAVTGDV